MKKLTRSAGVLLHVSSLPSPFATGVIGEEAKEFIEKLGEMGFSRWQVLPLGQVDPSGSPYCSVSAFAGEPAFIDPRRLEADGLITNEELNSCLFCGSPFRSDFDFSKKAIRSVLKTAYRRLPDGMRETVDFFASQNPWVNDYALFAALKEKNDNLPWWEWPEDEAKKEKADKKRSELKDETGFFVFEQFVFFSQWRSLKEYANSRGIKILGDMPIYVALDSVDVWANKGQFLIDEKGLAPKEVAGVPPDYFSEEGQLWGNPLYDWKKMEKDGFKWWIERIEHSLKIFDELRIDHFRAFASYWAIPAESETAKTGRWVDGPGMKLFSAVKEKLGDAPIIAEDLGVFGEDVVKLLEDTGFPGMRVIQFGFDPNEDSTHLPHNYPANSVAYVGTHDNNTILGWLWNADEAERAFALRYCCFVGDRWGEGGAHSGSCRAVIETLWRSGAATAIVAFQDMMGYGEDARMNTPGTSDDNWTFRTIQSELDKLDVGYYSEINRLYRRTVF